MNNELENAILLHSKDLLIELENLSDEEKEEEEKKPVLYIDRIPNIEFTQKQHSQKYNNDNEEKLHHKNDHYHSPVTNNATSYFSPRDNGKRIRSSSSSSSPRSISSSTSFSIKLQKSPLERNNSPISNGTSTLDNIDSYASLIEMKHEPTEDMAILERNVTSLIVSPSEAVRMEAPVFNSPVLPAKTPVERFVVPSMPSPRKFPRPPKAPEVLTINKHKYLVLKKIGSGSTSIVYHVLSITYQEVFALKWIKIHHQEERKKIHSEIKLLNSLKSQENIVKLLDFDEDDNVIRMIMEYGETDFTCLCKDKRAEKWDICFIQYYWNQMILAVSVVHSHKIVHSNLKPANFVIVKGVLKLLDFGLAMKFSEDTTSVHHTTKTDQIGLVDYMAPEAFSESDNFTKLDRRSDIWSLGCMFYEIIYGRTPFHSLSSVQKISIMQNPDFQIPFPVTVKRGGLETTIPTMLIDLLKQCLDSNPFKRPTITDLLNHPFLQNTFHPL